MRLEGKTALVTGGGTGIGLGVAHYFLSAGARVVIVGINGDEISAALESLSNIGEVEGWVCDVTDEEQVSSTVQRIDHLDVLIANAGSAAPGSVLQLSADQWAYTNTLNVTGTALCIKHAAIKMKTSGGSIVAISSIAAHRPSMWMTAYSASKASVEMLVKTAAAELSRFKIRVNAIAPGLIGTDAVMNNLPEDFRSQTLSDTLLGRYGTPEDIAHAAAFLSSQSASFITGQVLGVDGGCSLHTQDYERLCRDLYGDNATDNVLGPLTTE